MLGALLQLFAVVVVLSSALLAGRGWHIENGLFLVLGLQLLFYYLLLSAAGVGTCSRIALGGADVGALAAGWLFLCFSFLVLAIFSLIAATVADSSEALVVIARSRATLAESVVAINLLELRAQALFCLRWREELLQLLDGLSDLLFVACVVSQSDAEHLAHLSQVLDCEVEVLVGSSGRTAEGRLQSE